MLRWLRFKRFFRDYWGLMCGRMPYLTQRELEYELEYRFGIPREQTQGLVLTVRSPFRAMAVSEAGCPHPCEQTKNKS